MKIALGPRVSEKTEQSTAQVVLTNVSGASCSFEGFPTVALFDRHGLRLPFMYVHGGDQMITAVKPRLVRISGNGSVFFAFNKNACVGFTSRDSRFMRIALPGSSTMSRSVPLPHYPLLDYCSHSDPGSTITISPIEATATGVFCRTSAPCGKAAASPVAQSAGAANSLPRCRAEQLDLVASSYGEAGTQFIQTLRFTNRSKATCQMSGWPTVRVADSLGHPVRTNTIRVVQGSPSARPFKTVVLRSGAAASFDIYGADWNVSANRACPNATRVSVALPDALQLLVRVKLPNCGEFYVAPIVAGKTDRDSWSVVWKK
jgi:hypothetical protein